jgi:NAD+ synthase (glutamine-hydrolysing)
MPWLDWKWSLIQFNPRPGALEENAVRLLEDVRAACRLGAQLCVLPEASLSAYCIADLHRDLDFIRQSRHTLETMVAPRITSCAALIGYLDVDEGDATCPPAAVNAWALIAGGRILARGRKTLMADEGVLDDSRHYRPGDPQAIAPVRLDLGGRTLDLGVLICQDLWDDHSAVKPATLLRDRGAEVLVCLNSSPFHLDKPAQRLATARARVAETGLPLVYVNTCGVQDNGKNLIIFDGGSFALDQTGRCVHQAPRFRPGPSAFSAATVAPAPAADAPEAPTDPAPAALLADALTFGLADYFEKSGVFRRALLGLSGGIDSAVDACLAVAALGADRVSTVSMPSKFNSAATREQAARLARNLGTRHLEYPIQDQIDLKARVHRDRTGHPPSVATLENIQARERGNILMTLSQEASAMVIGNGNKTEFQRGYATLYGDIIGACMPLGDVQKLMVYALGRELNRRLGDPIPEGCFTIKASAELSEAQDPTRGGGDPFDYFIEGPLGVELIEHGRSVDDLCRAFANRALDPALWVPDDAGRSVYDKLDATAFEAAVRDCRRAIHRSAFKRVQAPPIFVVSPRSFGFDYREAMLLDSDC